MLIFILEDKQDRGVNGNKRKSKGGEKRKSEGGRETWRERSQMGDCGERERREEKPEGTGLSASSELGDAAADPNQESRATCPPTSYSTPIPTKDEKLEEQVAGASTLVSLSLGIPSGGHL